MESIVVLGTGLAMVTECYNTCFALRHGDEYLLTDAGGGVGILRQLKYAGISPAKIHNMIVTHAHCDHVLGVVWVLRNLGIMIARGEYEGNFHIWCHKELAQTIQTICALTLKGKNTAELFHDRIIFHHVEDGTRADICGWPVTFFDLHAEEVEQYGYWLLLDSGEKLTFLGDAPYNRACFPYVQGSDWLLSEAFCLYAHREHYKPYEKKHVTLREACELGQELGVSNLVVWHSEDDNYSRRKELFAEEGARYYSGKLHIPRDLDVINLN